MENRSIVDSVAVYTNTEFCTKAFGDEVPARVLLIPKIAILIYLISIIIILWKNDKLTFKSKLLRGVIALAVGVLLTFTTMKIITTILY